ncbi:hypothetical protein CEXT_320591 [Caerostris extrusa]|uniref:Uncharacterized protein n=1 Tax=Caerostris extrusa TaxID=172846 RepID=A0AAV4WJR3_CAEEX|nr:hypothetical protein CEXT_320591 [Caerostris extrusa]
MQQLPFSSTIETKGATCTLPKDAFRPRSRKKGRQITRCSAPSSPRNKTSRLSGDRSPIIDRGKSFFCEADCSLKGSGFDSNGGGDEMRCRFEGDSELDGTLNIKCGFKQAVQNGWSLI